MRILFWNELFLPAIGGAEIFTARLGRGLIARGHQVFVVADRIPEGLPESEILDGISVRRFPFRAALRALADPSDRNEGQANFAAIMRAIRALKQEGRFDIIHVNFSGPNPLFHLRTLQPGDCPTVVTFQTALTEKTGRQAGLVRDLLQHAAHVVSVSEAAARNAVFSTGYASDRISVIYPGIPDTMFETSSKPAGLPIVAFLGRLVTDKGADLAIHAIASLRGMARLNVIGDGPEKSRLQSLAEELSLGDSVTFSGYVANDERRRMLAEATLMVVPSRHEELFGMVAAEGALSSLPVVTCATGGLPEVVQDGVTGFVVPPNDANALGAAMRKLLADPALAKQMGKAGRERAQRKFLIEKTVNDYEALYRSAAGVSSK